MKTAVEIYKSEKVTRSDRETDLQGKIKEGQLDFFFQ